MRNSFFRSMNMIKELLAPAGDVEAGYAALFYGADAVYLGLQKFSARATAVNFDEPNLNAFVGYAHSLTPRRKVYVAINTLVQEQELPDLMASLDICVRCHVDGVIVQDLGVAKIVRDYYPELELHASTQMAVHNKEGALALKKFGFKRVVLARELSAAEIDDITSIPDLEIEAFIHGALCYSYSGLCLFSSMETGRSANRGKCLYPCRACFKGEEGDKHYFSMKDMALEKDVLKMSAYSLKIEGRKKSALYVAAVTDFYRRILDGKGVDQNRAENIKQIFSRPWCSFHFKEHTKNVVDRDFVGHRGLPVGKILRVLKKSFVFTPNHVIARHDGLQIDVAGDEKPFGFSLQKLRSNGKNVFEAKAGQMVEVGLPPKSPELHVGDMVYLASASAVKASYPYLKPKFADVLQKRPINVQVDVSFKRLTACSDGISVDVDGEFSAAQNLDKIYAAAYAAFDKTGDTPFILSNFVLNNPDNLFVPVSKLNDLRRKLYEKLPETTYQPRELSPILPRKKSISTWLLKTDQLSVVKAINLDEVDEVIFMLSAKTIPEDLSFIPQEKLRLALPTVCRQTKIFEKLICDFVSRGYKKWEIGNVWPLPLLSSMTVDISFDNSLYTLNSYAIAAASEFGASRISLSFEDTMDNLSALIHHSSLPVALPLYSDVPLFTSAVCLRSGDCKTCTHGEKWISLSKDGVSYQALSRDCQIFMFDNRAFAFVPDMAQSLAPDFYRVDFMYKPYSPEQAKLLWNKLRRFEPLKNVLFGNLERGKI